MNAEQFAEQYMALAHAIQTGVSYEQAKEDPHYDFNKHHRVGINTNMCEIAAIAKLLIDKGIFTEEEYRAYVINYLKKEVADYEARLSEVYKVKVVLA